MDHSESAKTRAGGFIALVTLALALWSFYNDRIVVRENQAVTMGTVMAKEIRRTRDGIDQEPKWRHFMQVAFLERQDWFHVPGNVYNAYKPGSQIEVIYNLAQTKYQSELVPATGRTKYYLLAVSIAAMGACIGMLIWAKRVRQDEGEPDAPSLEEALCRADRV